MLLCLIRLSHSCTERLCCCDCMQRTNRVYQYNLDPCGPTHILLGGDAVVLQRMAVVPENNVEYA